MSRKRRGFTLVELLVVITIIGMLVGLLMPAVQSAREAGRRTQCMNNQRQISLALHNYESNRGSFPGYIGEYSGMDSSGKIKQRKISWLISILPYLGRMDLNDLWKDLTIPASNPDNPLPGDNTVALNPIPGVMMRIGICPSHSPPSVNDAWLSYRVNVGRMRPNTFAPSTSDPSIAAEGVFTDQFQDNPPPAATTEQIVRVGLGFIDSKDGTSCTLMVSENSASVPPTKYAFEGRWAPLIQNSQQLDTNNIYTTKNNGTLLGFNWDGMDPENPNKSSAATDTLPNQKIYSNHPGGVIASFCDAHQYFLKTDIDPVIYMQLMSPSDRDVLISAGKYGIRDPLDPALQVPPLSEDRY